MLGNTAGVKKLLSCSFNTIGASTPISVQFWHLCIVADLISMYRCYQNCSVLGCATQCSQSATHLHEQFLQVQQIGFAHWDPYAMHGGGGLELYYCNMVEWFWSDSGLIWKTNWFPSVLWHCWFGHMTCKIVPDMICNVFGGTLNLAQSQFWHLCIVGDPISCIAVFSSNSTTQMPTWTEIVKWCWAANRH